MIYTHLFLYTHFIITHTYFMFRVSFPIPTANIQLKKKYKNTFFVNLNIFIYIFRKYKITTNYLLHKMQ